jgi:hypothetical protein
LYTHVVVGWLELIFFSFTTADNKNRIYAF